MNRLTDEKLMRNAGIKPVVKQSLTENTIKRAAGVVSTLPVIPSGGSYLKNLTPEQLNRELAKFQLLVNEGSISPIQVALMRYASELLVEANKPKSDFDDEDQNLSKEYDLTGTSDDRRKHIVQRILKKYKGQPEKIMKWTGGKKMGSAHTDISGRHTSLQKSSDFYKKSAPKNMDDVRFDKPEGLDEDETSFSTMTDQDRGDLVDTLQLQKYGRSFQKGSQFNPEDPAYNAELHKKSPYYKNTVNESEAEDTVGTNEDPEGLNRRQRRDLSNKLRSMDTTDGNRKAKDAAEAFLRKKQGASYDINKRAKASERMAHDFVEKLRQAHERGELDELAEGIPFNMDDYGKKDMDKLAKDAELVPKRKEGPVPMPSNTSIMPADPRPPKKQSGLPEAPKIKFDPNAPTNLPPGKIEKKKFNDDDDNAGGQTPVYKIEPTTPLQEKIAIVNKYKKLMSEGKKQAAAQLIKNLLM